MLTARAVSVTRETLEQRTTEALAVIADQYAVSDDLAALRRAEGDWEPLAIAMLAEAVAALLLDVRPRPGTMKRERR